MPITVEGPNGTMVEFPDGTSPETIQSAMQKQFSAPPERSDDDNAPDDLRQAINTADLRARRPVARMLPDALASKLASAERGLMQGATFGFSDEIIGALSGLHPDLTVKDVIEQERQSNAAAREANPKSFFSGEVIGGGVTGGAGVAKVGAVKAASAAGAAYGAGTAEGDVIERADDAAVGAALGAAGGKVAPYISGFVKGAASRIINRGGSLSRADNMLLKEVMRQNKVGKDDAISLIRNANSDTPELMFQTLGLQEYAEGAATRGQSARNVFEKAIIQQQRGQQNRINIAVKEIIDAGDFNALKGEIGEELSGRGSALYTEAFEQPFEISPNLVKLSQRPSMKRALSQGAKIAADEGISIKGNELLTYHYAKQALDTMIGTSVRKSGGGPKSKSLLTLKRELLSELDAVPQYGEARALWAGQKANESALDLGRNVLKMRAEDITSEISNYSAGEKQHLLAGVIQAIDDKLQTKALSHDGGAPFKAERVRNVLRAVMDDDKAARLIDMIDAESRLTQTGRRVRPSLGSPTAPKMVASERVGRDSAGPIRRTLGVATEVLPAPVQSVKRALNTLARSATREDPAVIDALATRLAGTPEDAAAAFANLSGPAQQRTSQLWQDVGGIGQFVTGMQTAKLPPRTQEQ